MKNRSTFKFTCAITVFLFWGQIENLNAQIANSYPNDIGISADLNVIFTEMGEESTLTNLLNNWSGNSSSNSVALDLTTSPPGSLGNQSIRLFTTGGPTIQTSIRTAYLRRTFPSFSGDTVYARWYAKYNTTGTFHHSGTRLGGSNPISNTTQNVAGILPNGSDFFYVGAEVKAGPLPCTTSKFDFFNYWPNMRHNSNNPPAIYYGNNFINSPAVSIDMSTWNCFEVRLILNNPVSGYGGEITMWINGNQVSDVKLGTLGNWNQDVFTPNIAGSPFEGFQFRNTTALNFNYFELMHYVSNDTVVGFINSVNYDHIVVAKNYIGPIYISTGINELNNTSDLLIYPNPANDIVKFSKAVKEVKVYNVYGQQVIFLSEETDHVSTKDLTEGIYIIQADNNFHKIIVRH